MGPAVGDVMNGLVCVHAVTRSVRDSAALLDATHGPDIGDPYCAPPPARPFLEEVGADPGKLRIAISWEAPNGAPIDPECVTAVQNTAALCAQLGHHVEKAAPEIPESMTKAFLTVWAAGVANSVETWAMVLERRPKQDELEVLTHALAEMGRTPTAHEYMRAIALFQRVGRTMGRFMKDYDVWITPTVAEPPPPLGTFDPADDNPLAGFMRASTFVPFTPISNATGQPAASLPLHWTADGLPVGVHLAARFGDEATLLRLSAQLEEAQPWRNRWPALVKPVD